MMAERPRDRVRLRTTLWMLIAAPTIWAAHFLFCYVFAAVRCAKGGRAASLTGVQTGIAAATAVALLAIVVCGYVARGQTKGGTDPAPHEQGTTEDRLRFLATSTLLLAGLSFVAVAYTALPALVFMDCR